MSQSGPPNSLSLLTPELSQRLKQHYENVFLNIVQGNRTSRFASEAPSLLAFRNYPDNSSDDDRSTIEVIQERFRNTVPLSEYDVYEPFVRKLFEQPCKQAEVENLFFPGYPSHVTLSSLTTGKTLKYYPKYSLPRSNPQDGTASTRSMFNCLIMHLGTSRTLSVEDETGQLVSKIPVCTASTALLRTSFNMGFDQDQAALAMKGKD